MATSWQEIRITTETYADLQVGDIVYNGHRRKDGTLGWKVLEPMGRDDRSKRGRVTCVRWVLGRWEYWAATGDMGLPMDLHGDGPGYPLTSMVGEYGVIERPRKDCKQNPPEEPDALEESPLSL